MHVLDPVAIPSVSGGCAETDNGSVVAPRSIRISLPLMPEPWPDKLPDLF